MIKVKNRFVRAFTSAVIFICVFYHGGSLFADIVTLKSGKRTEGKITEKQKDYIAIDTASGPVYYENKYIRSIEEGPALPAADEAALEDTGRSFKKGVACASQDKFDEAEKEFNQVRAVGCGFDAAGALGLLRELKSGAVSKEYASYVFKGLELLLNQKYREAIPELMRALEMKTNDPDVMYNLALAHYFSDDYCKAIEYAQMVLESFPEDAAACRLLANAYYLNGQHEQGIETLLLSRELFRKSGDFLNVEEINRFLTSNANSP
ncbi:MAG: tetratricopeptide repeat protein [Candidatus Omnitrophota bacterium]